MMRVFEAVADGVAFRFPGWLASFLRDLPFVLTSVGDTPDDPAAIRMNVPVYLDDPEANDDYWRWMGTDLTEGRRADRSAFTELVDAAEVEGDAQGTTASRAEAEAFLRVLAEGRLALAARMGVDVESDYEKLEKSQLEVLDLLAELQVLLIREMFP
jgi:hypothetical protein